LGCIDAPELKQPLGIESWDYLKNLLDEAGGKIKLNITTEGMAFAYEQYKKDFPLSDAVESSEQHLSDRHLGVWKDSNFVKPWD
jgi:endonuclease YncB( thermonuclease family)